VSGDTYDEIAEKAEEEISKQNIIGNIIENAVELAL
jgi:hypothetical protein